MTISSPFNTKYSLIFYCLFYREWLPLIIGNKGMEMIGEYRGYNPTIESTISNVFAASAFRFGHTMVNSVLLRLDERFEPISEGNLPLSKAFFAPWRLIQEGGVDPILRGLFASAAKLNQPTQVNLYLLNHIKLGKYNRK